MEVGEIMNKIIISFILCLICPCILGEELQLEAVSKVIFDRIQANNILDIGEVSLAELQAKLANVEFKTFDEGEREGWGSRFSAYYLAGAVYSSEQFDSEEDSPVSLLSLHEILGASGFSDNEYEKSIILKLLSVLPEDKREILLDSEMTKGQFGVNGSIYASGGTTVIGGGGELSSAWIKYILIKNMFNNHIDKGESETASLALDFILNLPFEPSDNLDSLSIGIREIDNGQKMNFESFERIGKSFVFFKPTVYLPRNILNQDSASFYELLNDLSKYVLSLMRANIKFYDSNLHQTLAKCNGRKLLINKKLLKLFPKNINYGDSLRSNFMNLCEKNTK